MERLLRVALRHFIRAGNLRVTTAGGTVFTFGDGSGPPAAIRFTTRAAECGVLFDPELKFGEAYVNGTLVVEQGTIADVLSVVFAQRRDGKPPLWRAAARGPPAAATAPRRRVIPLPHYRNSAGSSTICTVLWQR